MIKLFFLLFVLGSSAFADGMNETKPAPAWPLPNEQASTQMPLGQPRLPGEPMPDGGWTGGASYTPPGSIPVALEGKEAPEGSKMDLAHKNLMIDDGGQTLAASLPPTSPYSYAYGTSSLSTQKSGIHERLTLETETKSYVPDVSREWIAAEGETLKSVLKQWSLQEGWEVVWNTDREYPLKAGAIFNGRFTDVSSALVRSFGRALPPPYAKFYYGNRVLVIETLGDENN